MIIQVNNQSIRKECDHGMDIAYLQAYYEANHRYPLFKQVLIETRTDCNNRCPFCPHSFNQKPFGQMTWTTYTHIIDELADMGYNGRIALMLSNEPLLDDRLLEMIRYAKKKSPRFFLDITTNGRLLDLAMADQLFEAGIDNINVNDYRGDRNKYPTRLSAELQQVYDAYGNNPKITFQYRRTDEQLPNYGGNIPQELTDNPAGFCNFPFRKLVIAYNGDVLLCCNDFMYATRFGNVNNDRISDCWYCEAYNRIREALLENRRISLCAACNDSQNYNAF